MISSMDAKIQDVDNIKKIVAALGKQDLSRRALAQKAATEITDFTNNLNAPAIQEILRDKFRKNSDTNDIVKAIMKADNEACPSMIFTEQILIMDPAFIFRNSEERLLARNGMRLRQLGIKGIAKQLALGDGSIMISDPKYSNINNTARIAVDTGTIAIMSFSDVMRYNPETPAKKPYAYICNDANEKCEVRFSTTKSKDYSDTEIVTFEIKISDETKCIGYER